MQPTPGQELSSAVATTFTGLSPLAEKKKEKEEEALMSLSAASLPTDYFLRRLFWS